MTEWDYLDYGFYAYFQKVNEELFRRMFGNRGPGRKTTAAPEGEDEPVEGGFKATGPRDDLPVHLAHHGLKPGTPEGNAEARAWYLRERDMRVSYGELHRSSRIAVRDARLQRYRQSATDRLIEEMME